MEENVVEQKPKGKGGRPKHQKTEQTSRMVQEAAGYGMIHEHIADMIGIDSDTLRKWYKEELAEGKAKARMTIGKTIFQKAERGDTAMLIFWAKCQMKWQETQKIEQKIDQTTKVVLFGAEGDE